MPTETLRRDLRIGLRVLIKEKSFCALAVIVLALGIAGVTTMFSVVNGVMLRGFSFPTADRLVSLNFIDPTSATFFGVNGQVSSKDYEELLPQQQSFEKLAAYLNGSTVNITVDGHPQRYTGAYVTEEFLRILGTPPMMGRDFTAADNQPERRQGGDHRPRVVAARLRRRVGHHRQGLPPERQGRHRHRRDAAGLRVPDQRGALDSALQRVPAARAQRPGGEQPGGARPAETRRLSRSGERRGDDDGAALRGRLSRHQQAVQHRPGAAAARDASRRGRCAARSGRCSGSASACC